MDSSHPEIIIVKRKGDGEDAHHGGAWKIAFADFMTAMMAFFLVLWIINATDKDTKTVIARYFNPVKLENPSRATKGVHGMDTSQKVQTDETTGQQEPGSAPAPEPTPAKPTAEAAPASAPPRKDNKPKAAARPDSAVPVDVKASTSEYAIFSDPYMTIDRISGGRAALSPIESHGAGAPDPNREAASTNVDSFRDPFKPAGSSAVPDPAAVALDLRPPSQPGDDAEPRAASGDAAEPNSPTSAAAASESPTPSTATPTPTPASAIDAKPSETKPAQTPPAPPAPGSRANEAAEKLARELEQKLGPLAKSPASPAIDVKATNEGLLISLTDRLTFSMFAIGSAEPRGELIEAMNAIARILKDRPGAIVLRGHTDGRQYKTATYDNWRLSSARAQMAYYMLNRGGVPETRIDRVEGHADRELRDPAHPLAAENRRIEILLKEPKT